MGGTDIEIAISIIKYILTLIAGIVLGNSAVYFFNKVPAVWFCDYGEKPTKEMISAGEQRLKSTPWKYVFSMLFVAVGLYLVKDDWVYTIAVLAILWLLIELAVSDWKYRIVPDQFLILLAISSLGLIQYHSSWLDMLYGALCGVAITGATALIGKALYKRDAVGGGDIKLFAALGLIAGLYGIIAIFLITSFISGAHLVFLLATRRIKRSDTVPMVPYIAAAAGIYLLFLFQNIDLIISKFI